MELPVHVPVLPATRTTYPIVVSKRDQRKTFSSDMIASQISKNWSESVVSMMNCLYCSRLENYISLLHSVTDMICTVSLEESYSAHEDSISTKSSIENVNILFMATPCVHEGHGSPTRPATLSDDTELTIDPFKWLVYNISNSSIWLSNIISRAKVSFGVVSTALMYLQKIASSCDTSSSLLNRPMNSDAFSNIIFQRRLYRLIILTLLIVSSKYHQDKHYSNSVWAELSGFSLELINLMERVCLRLLYFDLYVEGDIVYYRNWLQYWIGFSRMLDGASVSAETHIQQSKPKKKKFTCLFPFKK